ncbi:MAG: TatA/E family twin arginine-targeting protein translocase, partial [Cyanobacteria bacterium P01_H01_bin.130]
FGIGLPEMVLIGIVALLVFGPKKLPEIGRSLGNTIRSFQDASKEFESEFKREAERVEEVAKTSMNATLEERPPAALESSETAKVPETVDAEVNDTAATAPQAAADSTTDETSA